MFGFLKCGIVVSRNGVPPFDNEPSLRAFCLALVGIAGGIEASILDVNSSQIQQGVL